MTVEKNQLATSKYASQKGQDVSSKECLEAYSSLTYLGQYRIALGRGRMRSDVPVSSLPLRASY